MTALCWFQSYLTNRVQNVVQQQAVTKWKQIGRGVPQGSCLSPLFFNIYVSDLPKQCGESEAIQFVDDLTNSAADKDPAIIKEKLTKSFEVIKTFGIDHELIINVS